MIGSLSGLLGVKKQPETLVRALMALAMLLGNNPAGLAEIAGSRGAVENLAVIMRSSDDDDSKHVAATIFSNLVLLFPVFPLPCCLNPPLTLNLFELMESSRASPVP